MRCSQPSNVPGLCTRPASGTPGRRSPGSGPRRRRGCRTAGRPAGRRGRRARARPRPRWAEPTPGAWRSLDRHASHLVVAWRDHVRALCPTTSQPGQPVRQLNASAAAHVPAGASAGPRGPYVSWRRAPLHRRGRPRSPAPSPSSASTGWRMHGAAGPAADARGTRASSPGQTVTAAGHRRRRGAAAVGATCSARPACRSTTRATSPSSRARRPRPPPASTCSSARRACTAGRGSRAPARSTPRTRRCAGSPTSPGCPPSAGGAFVQGGTIGNLSALVAAREAALHAPRPRARRAGRSASPSETHSSVKHALRGRHGRRRRRGARATSAAA